MNAGLRDSLAQVQELLGRATPGPWASAHSFRGVYSQHPTPGPVQVCRAPEHFHDTWRGNAEAMVAAVNFLHTHGPELMKMLDRHGAGDAEDAARYRWLREDRLPPPGERQPAAWIAGRGNDHIESDWLCYEAADAAIDEARAAEDK